MIVTKQNYTTQILPQLQKELKLENRLAVPKITKIVLNMGVSDPPEPKARQQVIENIVAQFRQITGQQPQVTYARLSIANFKLREGDPLGVMVTLRGEMMWRFLERLLIVALPRVKDFRGLPRTAFDGQGNYSMGIEEQIIFPEIEYDKIERIRSLQATIVTSTKSDDEALRLLELLGVPFEKIDENKQVIN